MRWFCNLRFRWQLLIAFACLLSIVAVQSLSTYRTARRNQQTGQWVEHTHQVIDRTNSALTGLVDMQTGYRGFLIAGDEEFLKPYESGKARYKTDIHTLERLTADNTAQVRRWQEIEQRAAIWQQTVAEPGIALRKRVATDTAVPADLAAFVTGGGGEAQFDAMRSLFDAATNTEQTLLAKRAAADRASTTHLIAMVTWGTVAAIVAGLAIAWLVAQALASRVEQLRDTARRMAAGDLAARSLHAGERSEVGQLARSFNEMAQALQQREQQMQSAQDVLMAQHRASENARSQNRAVLDATSDGMLFVSPDGRVVTANRRFSELFHLPLESLGGQTVAQIWPSPADLFDAPTTFTALVGGAPGATAAGTAGLVIQHAPERRHLALSSAAVHSPDGEHVGQLIVFRDVTREQQAAALLEHQAMYDALTDLPNRTLFSDRLEQGLLVARRNKGPLSLLTLDLDRFKLVNDTFGHHTGDLLLQEVAKRVQGIMRSSDTAARMGGDEFAIVLPGAGGTHARMLAVKIMAAFEEPFLVDGRRIGIGVSIGVSFFPDHGTDSEALLRHADAAMYEVKRGGGGITVYSPAHDRTLWHVARRGLTGAQ